MFKTTLSACIAAFVAVAVASSAVAATTTLDFNAPMPGTLKDSTGQGTGFTTRIPGSGSAIPANDPNLTLDTVNGRLIVGSTRSDFNLTGFGRNLAGMEAPAILLNGIGAGDFIVQAHYLDLHVDQASDQIGIFVGTSVDNVARGGVHEGIPFGGYQTFFTNSQNGHDGSPGGGAINQFFPGQEGFFEIGRIAGVWHFSWQNGSDLSLSGSVENMLIPSLDSQNDLYVGIFNHDARNTTPQNATLDYFRVTVVPEPSSFVLAGFGIVGLVGMSRRRRRKNSFGGNLEGDTDSELRPL